MSIDHLDKSKLVDLQGCSFNEFKRTLKPRWILLWSELLAGHLVIILTMISVLNLEDVILLRPLIIILSALIIGLAQAYLFNFFHEAAHGNIASTRKLNDILANIFIGIFAGVDIKVYRPIHFKHHQKLGTPEDTERSYFDALNKRFIIELLTGVKVLRVFLGHKKSNQDSQITTSASKKNFLCAQLLLSIILHSTILILALSLGHWIFASVWIIGTGIFMPFFVSLRQVLEHRDLDAKSHINYHVTPQGSTNRLFGDSLLARILGGAGFNRHLLHHWEPQIPYTQLRALEKFLLQTEGANLIIAHQTTYGATFKQLMKSS
jgi:fatty acid desaturase